MEPNVTAKRATLTIAEAAQVLGISKSLAYKQADEGKIPTIRLGDRWVVPRAQLERLINGSADASAALMAEAGREGAT